MKDIVIIADFCDNMDGKGNNRFMYLANMLKKDNKVEIVTSDFSHGKKAYFASKPQFDFDVTMLHEPVYSKNVCLKRFYSHYVWGKNVAEYLKTRKKPDVVYCALPTFYAGYMVAKYCEQNDVRFIIDIQDLWPEAFQMVFKIPLISDIAFAPFRWLANQSYKRADEIVAVSKTYVDRALRVNKKNAKGYPVFLGTNLADFDDNVRNNLVTTKPADEVWLGYCGTLGASYDLISVFEALRMVKDRGVEPPKFIVMGSGPRTEEFKQRAEGLNVEFTGNLPYPQMCGMLAACDMVVNPITHNAAQSIINKHADYAAVGLPVINTQECAEYRDLVSKFQFGFNVSNSDPKEMADTIIQLLEDRQMCKEMGKKHRECAEKLFDRDQSYLQIERIIIGGGYENVTPVKYSDEIWLGYCGSLSDSYDIKLVVDALVVLQDSRLRFVVMGDGFLKQDFMDYAKEKEVKTLFVGSLPYSKMCGMLASCDMVVNPIKGRSAASIINKHADYAASGLPVLNTQESEEYRKLVEDYNMGFNCVNGDAVDLANKILILLNDSKLRKDMGRNARRCAEELFDRGNSYRKIERML